MTELELKVEKEEKKPKIKRFFKKIEMKKSWERYSYPDNAYASISRDKKVLLAFEYKTIMDTEEDGIIEEFTFVEINPNPKYARSKSDKEKFVMKPITKIIPKDQIKFI